MKLKFLGRGSASSDENTSAYFITGENEIVIIDCPYSTLRKLKQIDLASYRKIYFLITHTHTDNISGLGSFIKYAKCELYKYVTIVAPSAQVASDIKTFLDIVGISKFWYQIVTGNQIKVDWLKARILTTHDPILNHKCFGYHLYIEGTNVVYTGDTSKLQSFIPFLTSGTEFYVDSNVRLSDFHLSLAHDLGKLRSLVEQINIKVYIMHCDDIDRAKKMVANIPNIEIVPIA